MDETVSLFERVMFELEKGWNPEASKNTIDDKWDHVLLQAFFASLGTKLSFKVACERNRRWDVAWLKEAETSGIENWVEVEIEPRKCIPVQKAFKKICIMSDAILNQFEEEKTSGNFSGILVVNNCFYEASNSDYFYDNFLKPEEGRNIRYPQNRALDILIIDIEKRKYRIAKVGPSEKYEPVKNGTF